MLKGYRTILFNLLAAVIPVIELTELRAVVPDNYLPIYVLVLAMGNLYLRSVTTTPIGKS
jgi:hypothetical protein